MPIWALAAAARRLGGGNVRAALEQLRGHADGDLGQGEIWRLSKLDKRRKRNAEFRKLEVAIGAMACSYWARATPTSMRWGAHGFELGAGLGHVCLGADSAGKATLGRSSCFRDR